MKFVLIFGPQAVRKMTVGEELAKETGLKLFHNHMTIDLLVPFFGFTDEMWRLCHRFCEEIFQSYAQTDQEGLIFTFIWAFNLQEDWERIQHIQTIFQAQGAEIYFIELFADLDERMKRNRTPHRLEEKPSKRDIVYSENELLQSMKKQRMNSLPMEIKEENYLRLDNTHLTPKQAAEKIKNFIN
ncbi:MAG: AAA family ATPase [Sporolactobacillus sp.]